MSAIAFGALLESLEVPRRGVLYVQSSTDWLARAGFAAPEVLQGLRDWVSATGTLVMPSYPCRTSHAEYLAGSPTYDVRKTPAGIGLIAEVFRRGARVSRSLDPDFSIAAEGPDAESLTNGVLEPDPFGRQSTYERMIARSATLLGLGVSLNTNSFIHVIDSRYQLSYPRSPYVTLAQATVIDRTGQAFVVPRLALAPEFQQKTKPSAVAVAIGDARPDMLASRSIEGAMFFRWRLPEWADWCDGHARSSAQDGRWPCWLQLLNEL